MILVYAGLLAVLLLGLGLVLNLVIGRVLYSNELSAFQTEARAVVGTSQKSWDALVRGQPADQCASAVSYQEGFQQAIADPLLRFPGIESVYLLDRRGVVLASADGSGVGQAGPNVTLLRSAQLIARARASQATGTGYLTDIAYTAQSGQAGVDLLAVRYPTTSFCVDSRGTEVGVIEVITSFPGRVPSSASCGCCCWDIYRGAAGGGSGRRPTDRATAQPTHPDDTRLAAYRQRRPQLSRWAARAHRRDRPARQLVR